MKKSAHSRFCRLRMAIFDRYYSEALSEEWLAAQLNRLNRFAHCLLNS